ncbi:MAG: hypothetical protein ACOYN6_09935 [Ignavibacteria bacterium]
MVCPYCKNIIKGKDEKVVCFRCEARHHKNCWDEHKGCSTDDCYENPNIKFQAENVGNKTLSEIQYEIAVQKKQITDEGICPQCGKGFDKTLQKCFYCGYDEKIEKVTNEPKEEFHEEFESRLKEKTSFKNQRRLILFTSIALVSLLIVLSAVFSYIRLNEYYKSEDYKVDLFLKEWTNAWESKDKLKYMDLLDKEYQYVEKKGKPLNYDQRVKQVTILFDTTKRVSMKISKKEIVKKDSANYINVKISQTKKADKKEDNEIKTLRLYKSVETNNQWKVFREYSE